MVKIPSRPNLSAPSVFTAVATGLPLLAWTGYAMWSAGTSTLTAAELMQFGGLTGDLLWNQGQIWRVGTALLLHGHPWHLAMTLTVLFAAWARIREGRVFLGTFLTGGLLGLVVSASLDTAWHIGASGGIFALATYCALPRRLLWWIFILANLAPALWRSSGLPDHTAHFAGILVGAAYWVLTPPPPPK